MHSLKNINSFDLAREGMRGIRGVAWGVILQAFEDAAIEKKLKSVSRILKNSNEEKNRKKQIKVKDTEALRERDDARNFLLGNGVWKDSLVIWSELAETDEDYITRIARSTSWYKREYLNISIEEKDDRNRKGYKCYG